MFEMCGAACACVSCWCSCCCRCCSTTKVHVLANSGSASDNGNGVGSVCCASAGFLAALFPNFGLDDPRLLCLGVEKGAVGYATG